MRKSNSTMMTVAGIAAAGLAAGAAVYAYNNMDRSQKKAIKKSAARAARTMENAVGMMADGINSVMMK